MSGKEDYIIKLRLDSAELVKDYEKTFKKLQKGADKVAQMTEKEVQNRRIAEKLTRQQAASEDKIHRRREVAARRVAQTQPIRSKQYLQDDLGSLSKRAERARVSDPGLRERMAGAQSRIQSIQGALPNATSARQVRKLQQEYREVNNEIRGIIGAQNRYNRSLSKSNMLASKFKGSIGRTIGGFASVYALGEIARAVFHVGREMDSMRASLLAASGGAKEAAENFEFLKQTSRDLGKDIQTMTGGFNRIGVAAKSAGFNAAETKEIFLAASEASTTFGLDTQRSGLVMLAMSQILSKGKVSLEEMGRQLGENLPIAMRAGADAMNMPIEQFIKQVESGKVMAKDFMLPFARQMRMMVRENGALAAAQEKLTAQQQRMNTEFKVLIDEIFQSGLSKTIGGIFKLIADVVQRFSGRIKETFVSLGDAVDVVVKLGRALTGLTGDLDDSNRAAGLLLRTWWAILSVWYKGLQAIELMSIGLEKIGRGASFIRFLPGGRELSLANAALQGNTQQGSNTNNKNISISVGSVQLNSNTDNPKDFAFEFSQQLSHMMGTY